MRRRNVAALGAAGLFGLVAVPVVRQASSQDEGDGFTLDCTLDGQEVTCSGVLPDSPTTSTTPPESSTSSTTAPETTEPATSSSTSPAETTTTMEATTTTPPVAGDYLATFDVAADFEQFDRGLSGFHPSVDPNYIKDWEGDHSHACAGPTTSRNVHLGQAPDISELFWHCAPGGPDSGHIMTSLNPLGYAYVWFSPARYFVDVDQVCWDSNLTMMGGRKWTQVSVSTRAEVERTMTDPDNNPATPAIRPTLDLGYSHPGFQEIGGPTTEVIPTEQTVAVTMFAGFQTLYTGNRNIGSNPSSFPSYKIEDVATRYRQCMIDNGNDSITLTMELGNYSGDNSDPNNLTSRRVQSRTFAGISLPDGEVRVAFTDANYDPPKDGEYDPGQNTWHWDNIAIEVR